MKPLRAAQQVLEVFYSIYVCELSIIYDKLDAGFGIKNLELIP